ASPAQVMHFAGDIGEITTHLELDGWLAGGAQEIFAVEARFGDGRIDGLRGVVRATVPVGEPRARRRQVRERRHHDRRVRSAHAIRDRYQVQLPELRADA